MSPGTRADYEPGPGHRETRGGPPGTDQVTPNYVPTQTPVTTGGASPFPYTRLAGDIPKYIKSPGPVTTEGSSPFPYTRQVGDIPDYTAFADTQGIDESKTARELKREDRRALAEKIRRYLKFPPAYDEKGNPIPTFSKTGPQQMEGLPEGITSDKEYINIVMNLDIPITEKWSLLGNIGYGKFRDKIEYGDDELFLQEGGGKSRKVGIGYNQGDEDGLSGSFMYNPDTGGYNVGFTKQVDFNKWLMGKADGGIAGIMNKFS